MIGKGHTFYLDEGVRRTNDAGIAVNDASCVSYAAGENPRGRSCRCWRSVLVWAHFFVSGPRLIKQRLLAPGDFIFPEVPGVLRHLVKDADLDGIVPDKSWWAMVQLVCNMGRVRKQRRDLAVLCMLMHEWHGKVCPPA